MSRALRIASAALIGLVLGLALIAAGIVVLTRTEWGVERVRRFGMTRLERSIEGRLDVGRITTVDLLGGATLYDVVIDDPRGRPFLRLDSAAVRYDWRTLVGGRIVLDSVVAYGPEVYFERLPGDTLWNFERIFPDDPEDVEPDRLVLLRPVHIVNGLVVLRMPLEPEPGKAIEPGDTARILVEPAPGGLLREYRFEDVDAVLPRVLWQTPAEEGRLFEIASLSTRGFVFEHPFHLQDMRGTVTLRDSVVSFDVPRFELPASAGAAIGRYVDREDRAFVDVRIDADTVAFQDLQWLHPPLPEDGGGNLVFRIQTQDPAGTLWLATDAHLRAPGTEITGSFGVVTGDTLYFTRVSLRASPLNLELLEQVLPVDLPVEGLLVGTVVVDGPISSLTTRGDLRLARMTPAGTGSALRWSGTVDLQPPYALQNVRADVADLDLALLAALGRDPRLRGTVSGRLEATGRLDRSVSFAALVRHRSTAGEDSELEAWGRVADPRGDASMDVEIEARPVELDALAAVFPQLGRVQGQLRGPIRIRGSLADLHVVTEIETPGGVVGFDGRFDLAGPVPRYRADADVADFRLDRLLEGVPVTSVTGGVRLEGQGITPDSAEAGLLLELADARVGPLAVRHALARIDIRDGLARVDTLVVHTAAGQLDARGAFGLAGARRGSLQIEIAADSLAAIEPLVFPDTLAPAVAGAQPERLAGRLRMRATIEGTLADFDARGELRLSHAVYDRIRADALSVSFDAARLRTDSVTASARADIDSLDVLGRPFTRVRVETEIAAAEGIVRAEAEAEGGQAYRVESAVRRDGDGVALALRDLSFGAGLAGWRLAAPSAAHVGAGGVRVDSLEMTRSIGQGRLRAHGWLPWLVEAERTGARVAARELPARAASPAPADFRLDFRQLRLAEYLRIVAQEPATDGVLSGFVEIRGVPAAPQIRGDVAVDDFRFQDVRVDRLDTRASYADRRLDARLEAQHDGRRILFGQGSIPLDLALTPVPDRRLDEPLAFELRADSVPAALITSLVDGFRDVRGRVDGSVTVRGTTVDPALAGELVLEGGAATYLPSGVRYSAVQGTFAMRDESVIEIDVRGRTAAGSAAATGRMTFRPIDDPAFDLTIRAREFDAARRRDVEMVGSGELRLAGRYTAPRLSGTWRVDRGALYLDELWRQYQIVELGRLFDVVDTSRVAIRQILPPSESPFLRNLIVEAMTVQVGRDFWLRSPVMNVEVSGDLAVAFDRSREDLRLTGTLDALRGVYQLYYPPFYRRFQVRRGTVEFPGTPGIDPNLDFTAVYRTRTRSDPLDILALVTGTLQNPRVRLTSEAEPPISESDLASYLIFGRPTYELAPGESRALGAAGLGVRAVAPGFLLGYAATGLESFAQTVGIDYLAITATESAPGEAASGAGLAGLFAGAQVELGQYISEGLYLALSQRVAGAENRGPSARLEWRFRPTWTAELFWEDRFARSPYLNFQQSQELRKAYGFFLFREWGY